jgi:F0F1-type ATP synthase membrane subunit b/b'
VLVAWDDEIVDLASRELEELREEARKSAAEKRSRRVSAAAEAF